MCHTDLGQNAVFQKIQDKLHYIQDNQSWPFSETVPKNFQNHPYGQPVLTFDERQICQIS